MRAWQKHDGIFLTTQVVSSLGGLSSSASSWYLFKCRRTEHFTTCYLWPDEIMCLPVLCSVCFPNFEHCARIMFHGSLAANRRMKPENQHEYLFNTTSSRLWLKLWRLVETLLFEITPFFQILTFFLREPLARHWKMMLMMITWVGENKLLYFLAQNDRPSLLGLLLWYFVLTIIHSSLTRRSTKELSSAHIFHFSLQAEESSYFIASKLEIGSKQTI